MKTEREQGRQNTDVQTRIAELEAELQALRGESGSDARTPKLHRAYSPTDILKMHIPSFAFTGDWEASLGHPAKCGVWIIWGRPGNGKTSFVMQLSKYLCRFDKVIYDSLEEGTGLSVQKSMLRHGMNEVSRRFILLDREPLDQLGERLAKRKSPGIIIVDSLQYSGLTYTTYKRLKEDFPNKLFVFVSHAEGARPAGRVGRSVEYDADIKILVEGFRASCKSRYMDRPSVPYTIWQEGAVKYTLGNEDYGREDEEETT